MLETIYVANNSIHTVIGSIALIAGLIALLSVKGSDKHKKAGKVFYWFIIITALSSFYPVFYKFQQLGPLAILMAVATIYLAVTSVIAIKHQNTSKLLCEKFLVFIPLLLLLMPLARVIFAVKNGNFDVFVGPLLFVILFAYCLVTDIAILRNRQRAKIYWLKRHLTRMLLAFAIGIMALLRIGINLGVTFEMSVIIPLIGAFLIIVYFSRKLTTQRSE